MCVAYLYCVFAKVPKFSALYVSSEPPRRVLHSMIPRLHLLPVNGSFGSWKTTVHQRPTAFAGTAFDFVATCKNMEFSINAGTGSEPRTR